MRGSMSFSYCRATSMRCATSPRSKWRPYRRRGPRTCAWRARPSPVSLLGLSRRLRGSRSGGVGGGAWVVEKEGFREPSLVGNESLFSRLCSEKGKTVDESRHVIGASVCKVATSLKFGVRSPRRSADLLSAAVLFLYVWNSIPTTCAHCGCTVAPGPGA